MAYRDRSQKISFIYENPYKLLKSIEERGEDKQSSVRVKAERPHPLPMGVTEAEAKKAEALKQTLVRLKGNMTRLQHLQDKVSFMIKELDRSTVRKKKK